MSVKQYFHGDIAKLWGKLIPILEYAPVRGKIAIDKANERWKQWSEKEKQKEEEEKIQHKEEEPGRTGLQQQEEEREDKKRGGERERVEKENRAKKVRKERAVSPAKVPQMMVKHLLLE